MLTAKQKLHLETETWVREIKDAFDKASEEDKVYVANQILNYLEEYMPTVVPLLLYTVILTTTENKELVQKSKTFITKLEKRINNTDYEEFILGFDTLFETRLLVLLEHIGLWLSQNKQDDTLLYVYIDNFAFVQNLIKHLMGYNQEINGKYLDIIRKVSY